MARQTSLTSELLASFSGCRADRFFWQSIDMAGHSDPERAPAVSMGRCSRLRVISACHYDTLQIGPVLPLMCVASVSYRTTDQCLPYPPGYRARIPVRSEPNQLFFP